MAACIARCNDYAPHVIRHQWSALSLFAMCRFNTHDVPMSNIATWGILQGGSECWASLLLGRDAVQPIMWEPLQPRLQFQTRGMRPSRISLRAHGYASQLSLSVLGQYKAVAYWLSPVNIHFQMECVSSSPRDAMASLSAVSSIVDGIAQMTVLVHDCQLAASYELDDVLCDHAHVWSAQALNRDRLNLTSENEDS